MVEEQRARLEAYLAAERAILNSQSYQIGDRTLTRADLKYVQATITELMEYLSNAEMTSGRVKRAVFIA